MSTSHTGRIVSRQLTLIDPLYGLITSRTSRALRTKLYQTNALARLRDISLSSVPGEMLPTGQPSSRFEHSAGVAHLAVHLCERPEFAPWRDELIVACLFHDTGSVAFSHAAEIFQYDLTSRTHEQTAIDALSSADVAPILAEHDVDPERVRMLIEGRHPELGGLLAGSIDLDNLDNSARLLRALGGAKEPPYSPMELLDAFQLVDGQLVLDSTHVQQLQGWVRCREMLYGELLYHPDRVAAASMLYRAMETAYATGILGEEFFGLSEGPALAFLRSGAVPQATRRLIERAIRWQFYERVAFTEARDEAERQRILALASDWRIRKRFADRIAETVGIGIEQVAVQAGRDKTSKEITLPFVGRHAKACELLFDPPAARYSLHVFVDMDCTKRQRTACAKAAEELLVLVDGVAEAHSFM